ncbi:sensor histidine kinase [Streptomyces sp. M2CJ-2]|uniref:sensor histidine kinase n=1 Tax=Streptomyces sp. M2CJ-2 TaxID=2803948 RepID=UPI00192754A0|nr:sensor histidine kinase [Streptomyces sp. M2CJ-2]MBL3666817.1 sensor histidine kinase [Streptomyces sp. M2CJ-2]
MIRHISEAAFWGLSAGLIGVLVLLARQRNVTTDARRRASALEDAVRVRDAEIRHFATVRLPALTDAQRHEPTAPQGPLDEKLAVTQFGRDLDGILEQFTGVREKAREHADRSARSALKGAMRAVQGLANEQQLAISEMQNRHDDPEVLQDLLHIDHTNSQFGRRAQAIAVLCGAWPGRQRDASTLSDVVRGATSRIRDYRRVVVHGHAGIAVVSQAVEPVVLTIAELLDNAARHSEPNTSVEVRVKPAHNGTSVVIDDAGVGMHSEEVERASAVLSGRHPVDVTRLGEPPQFGLPVAGVLAARYGFRVSIDTQSPYGGVRAVVFLPDALLTRIADDLTPVPSRTAGPDATLHPDLAARTGAPHAPAPGTGFRAPLATANGLPRRRRRLPQAGPAEPAPAAAPDRGPAPKSRPPEETASTMGAWQRGARSARADNTSDEEGK